MIANHNIGDLETWSCHKIKSDRLRRDHGLPTLPFWQARPCGPPSAVPTARAVGLLGQSFSEEALRTRVDLMRNSELPGSVRIRAATAVLDRGLGLPTQPIDVMVSRVLAKKLVECSLDELRAIESHVAESAIDNHCASRPFSSRH
jgi:hypothetical protein